MRTYTINGIDFEHDETLTYLDFYVDGGHGHLVHVLWDDIFQTVIDGNIKSDDLEYHLIMMDRWFRDVPRKRFYRKMVLDGFSVLSDEYWFDNMSDEEAEKIFTGLENSARVARKFLETFMPELAEQCKQDHHPAEKYYIEP